MKRSKGFTLIELLAVIVILAVIALIAVPQILKILEKARISAAEDTTYGIVKSAENYVTEFMLQNNGNFVSSTLEFKCENEKCELQNIPGNYNTENLTNLDFKGTKPTNGIVTINERGVNIIAKDLIINGFTCNYPVDGKAKCKSQGEATEITSVDVKISGNSVEIFADANGTVGKYEYAISDAQVPEEERENLSYSSDNTITGLTNNKTYYVYVKATAGNNVIIKEAVFVFTLPSAEIIVENELDWTQNKSVTIKYPSGEYEKSYKVLSIDGSTTLIEETPVTEEEITIPIDVNCIITAIVKSGDDSQPISKEITKIDTTAPTTSSFTYEVNETTITVTASATDSESDIYGYQFTNDGGNTWLPSEPQASNIYSFENLTVGNSYDIKVKAYNNTYQVNKETSYLDSEKQTVLIPRPGPTINVADATKTYKAIVYLDPTDLSKECTASNTTVATGTKSGCMKWYAYAETDTTYDLILAHNTTATVKNFDTAQTQVKTDTKNWDSSLNARNITANEIATISGHPTFQQATATRTDDFYFGSNNNDDSSLRGNYSWLYNYTYTCKTRGCDVEEDNNIKGYWTQTKIPSSTTYAWHVNYTGDLGNSSSVVHGVRPVITVSKDLFN